MRRGAFVRGLLAVALAGCSGKPPTAAPREKSVDEQIAEALKTVDPILLYERAPLSDDENAFVLWSEAIGGLADHVDEPPPEDISDGVDGTSPFPDGEAGERLAAWVQSNREALDLLDAGLRRDKCQLPRTDVAEFDREWLAPLRTMARMKLIRAKMRASRGDRKGAAGDISDVLRLGGLMAEGEGVVIDYLVAVLLQSMGSTGARWLAGRADVPQETLLSLIRTLEPDVHPGSDAALAIRVEFHDFFVPMHRHILNEMREEGAPKALAEVMWLELGGPLEDGPRHAEAKLAELLPDVELVDPGETVRLGGEAFARDVRRALTPWEEAPNREPVDVIATMESWRSQRPPRNPVGRLLVDILTPVADKLIERSFGLAADRSATRAALALRLFEMRMRRLPERLEELVTAGILDAVPVDPFCDKPLRYSRERRRVWSVGPDESDDGGRDEPAKWTGRDYVLGIPSAERP